MKTLKQYLQENKIDNSPKTIHEFNAKLNKIDGEFLWNDSILYSFEEFCNDNNVDVNDNEIFENALNFFDTIHWHSTNLNVFTDYDYHQEYFYETLTHSLDSEYVINYVKRIFDDIIDAYISIATLKSNSSKKHIDVIAKRNINENEEFKHVLNFINYCIILSYESNGNFFYRLKPNVSDDVTDMIHNQKYIYHVTSKQVIEKILKFGLHPHSKKTDDWMKTFIFTKQTDMFYRFSSFWRLQQRLRKEKLPDFIKERIDFSPVVLKIDVSKLQHKLKFFVDDNYVGTNAYYTFEPITPKAIVDHIDLNLLRKNPEF